MTDVIEKEIADTNCATTCKINSFGGTIQDIKKDNDQSQAEGRSVTLKTTLNVRTVDYTEESRYIGVSPYA